MNRLDLIKRVRSHTRDLTSAVFREIDIIDFLNEGIDRVKSIIPELRDMDYLVKNNQSPKYLPSRYHHLLAVYSTSRCFAQDDRHHQAAVLMNEFEFKLNELLVEIESGRVVIVDPDTGLPVDSAGGPEYVVDAYYNTRRKSKLFGGE